MSSTDGEKRYLPFEGIVWGLCVNPLFRISLVGCLLFWILRKLPGSWRCEPQYEGPPGYFFWDVNLKVLMKSETRTRSLFAVDMLFSFLLHRGPAGSHPDTVAAYFAEWHTSHQWVGESGKSIWGLIGRVNLPCSLNPEQSVSLSPLSLLSSWQLTVLPTVWGHLH